jgi:hypothetical protein
VSNNYLANSATSADAAGNPSSEILKATTSPLLRFSDATVSFLPFFIASMVTVWSDTGSRQRCDVQVEKAGVCYRDYRAEPVVAGRSSCCSSARFGEPGCALLGKAARISFTASASEV